MNNTTNSGDRMGINPNRKQWLAARERVIRRGADVDTVTEAILGPCPPEDAPEPFLISDSAQRVGLNVLRWAGLTDGNDNLVVDAEALETFVNAVPESSIPEAAFEAFASTVPGDDEDELYS